MRKYTIGLTVVAILSLALLIIALRTTEVPIDSFKSCVAAGRPIQESYPERCVGSDGQTYTNPDQVVLPTE